MAASWTIFDPMLDAVPVAEFQALPGGEKECGICWSDTSNPVRLKADCVCGKIWCNDCIRMSLLRSDRCPRCQHKVIFSWQYSFWRTLQIIREGPPPADDLEGDRDLHALLGGVICMIVGLIVTRILCPELYLKIMSFWWMLGKICLYVVCFLLALFVLWLVGQFVENLDAER